jgi:Flp pilus assembly protein TadB
MIRWIATIIVVAAAAGAGFLAGYMHWAGEANHAEQLQRRVQLEDSETAALRTEKRDLEERIEQIMKEQERLAQDNESLRKEQTKQQLLTGQGGNLPVLPPK